jgi:hypothetical protein
MYGNKMINKKAMGAIKNGKTTKCMIKDVRYSNLGSGDVKSTYPI